MASELRDHIGSDPSRLSAIESLTQANVLSWLLDLPFELGRQGMVPEAAALGARYAEITEPENFLGDRAIILAEGGRHAEAVAQAEENLFRFEEDPWISIKAGDVYAETGDKMRAESLYRRGLDLAGDDRHTRVGAVERLLSILEGMDRTGEADALVEAERTREEALDQARMGDAGDAVWERREGGSGRPYVRPAPKIGRNDPCPCGSGKKYKRCCHPNAPG